jgi:hypothetical protein
MATLSNQKREQLAEQIECALLDNGWDPTPPAMFKIVDTWWANKGALVELLSKHSKWNEDQLGILCRAEHKRNIVSSSITLRLSELFCLIESNHSERAWESYQRLRTAVLTDACSKVQNSTVICDTAGIKAVKGKKWSRVINAWAKAYNLDTHADYNRIFAGLSDNLSPLVQKHTGLLSVHPADYLLMSYGNSWTSCQSIDATGNDAGCHCSGTLSYLLDGVSMVFYTVSDTSAPSGDAGQTVTDATPLRVKPKLSRQMFCYAHGVLLQSRLYPDYTRDLDCESNRSVVQSILAECEGVPNLWVADAINKAASDDDDRDIRKELKPSVCSAPDATHYPDYHYAKFRPALSRLKGQTYRHFFVGHEAICVHCGEPHDNEASLYCSCQDDIRICARCGNETREYYTIDGDDYCCDCVSYCGNCECHVLGDVTSVNVSAFHVDDWCMSCCDTHAEFCSECGDAWRTASMRHDECLDAWFCPICYDNLQAATEEKDSPTAVC